MKTTYERTTKKTLRALRGQALASLQGKWLAAVLAMILALLLGAQLGMGGEGSVGIDFNVNLGNINADDADGSALAEEFWQDVAQGAANGDVGEGLQQAISGVLDPLWVDGVPGELPDSVEDPEKYGELLSWLLGASLLVVAVAAVIGVAYTLLLGTPGRIGHLRFRLQLLDGDARVETVFSGFGRGYWRAVGLRLLRGLYLFLWGLPSSIMGVIAAGGLIVTLYHALADNASTVQTVLPVAVVALAFSLGFSVLPLIARYRYAMSDYVMAENPAMGVRDALRESTRMMKGNKWRLFCLQLSFLGWLLLGVLSCGIGFIWIAPYVYQAEAALYHEISGREAIHAAVLDMKELMAEL